jgi:hypothetical protein
MKLQDMSWKEDEDDAKVGENLASSSGKGSGQHDNLASAVFTGRPQNPYSDEF